MQKNRKRKIAFIVDFIHVGGGPMGYVYNIMKGLEKVEGKPFRITFVGFNTTLYPKTKGLVEFCRKIQRITHRCIQLLKKQYVIRKYDICVFQGYQNPKYEMIARKNGKICIYMPHSPSIMADEAKMMAELSGKIMDENVYRVNYDNEEKLFEYSDYIVFPSINASKPYFDAWQNIIDKKKVYYLKSGTIYRYSDKDYPLRDRYPEKMICAFIGRYVTHKGFDVFCKVANEFRNDDSIVFVAAGSGPLLNLVETSNVNNIGFISDVGSLMKNVDVVVIPNRIAYYDLLPIECASYGKPMIFSYVGGNIDQLEEFPDSLCFKNEDVNDLCEQLKKALRIYTENKKWGSKNLESYSNSFTEYHFAQRWIEFLKKI